MKIQKNAETGKSVVEASQWASDTYTELVNAAVQVGGPRATKKLDQIREW
jgi:hypothetical protein